MKLRPLALALVCAAVVFAQQAPSDVAAGPVPDTLGPNLPQQKIGPDDLLGVSVYDAPELTRTVRVDSDGMIRLPMVKGSLAAAGLTAADLEKKIAETLVSQGLLVDPIVTVSIAEYRSRPITVVGAVKMPLTFQATGTVTLLDAISRAGGLTDNAGSDILVTRSLKDPGGAAIAVPQRISVASLIGGTDPDANVRLQGGEEIRVPDAGAVYVVGNVRTPGMYPIRDGRQSSVMKLLAVSGGVLPYSQTTAYIYRTEGGSGGRAQIPVDLKKIIERKSPDVAVLPQDILYIPENTAHKAHMNALDKSLLAGLGLLGTLLVVFH